MNSLAAGIQIHQELNPKLWDDFKLRPEVRDGLLEIAREFYKFVKVPIEVNDVIVTGSQCSYTYTEHSDLDLHIIVNYANVACDQPVDELFNTKRDLWKLKHDITIHGVPVECYVEDTDKPVRGSTYSLLKNTWIDRPQAVSGTPAGGVERVAHAWIVVITAAMQSRDLEQLESVRAAIKQYRQAGLDQDGELSRANLVFKSLRNTGILSKLIKAITVLKDRDLSVPN
jgi:hypothetical protein